MKKNLEEKKTALATVVLVEGSAYRRAGARMLITEDGQLTGAISGGCLEGDALRKARMVILQQEPLLVTYDTMSMISFILINKPQLASFVELRPFFSSHNTI